MHIIEKIREREAQFAANPALIEGVQKWTHAQLWDRVDRLSQGLIAFGISKGDVVAAWLPNCHEAIETELAVLQIGAIWVTLNTRVSWSEVRGVLHGTRPRVMIVDSARYRLIRDSGGLAELEGIGLWLTGADPYEELDAPPEAFFSYEMRIAQSPPDRPGIEISENDVARLRYTSGTTGKAKAAVLTHRVYLASLRNLQHELPPMDENDRVLHAAPLTHASGAMMFPVLAAGGANVVIDRFDADEILDFIERERITTMFIVPTMIQRLIHSPRFRTADLSSLRGVMYGGAPTPLEILNPFIEKCGGALIHILGMTEAPYPICTLQRDEHWVGNPRLGAVGKPTTVCEVKLVDDAGREVPTGEVGEIWIRGDNVMSGYWNDPESTREVMQDGWLKSGDLAVKDDDGFIRIVDRKKDVIISGGFNVYPKELEETLAKIPGVAEVAVVGQLHPDWGELVAAYFTPKPRATLDREAIEAFCRRELASYKRPKRIEILDELPKNPSGKILKKELAGRS